MSMPLHKTSPRDQVIKYYHTLESRIGYRLMGGRKHFGYYLPDEKKKSIKDAQIAMNDQLAKRLNLLENASVLDAGCGEGGVALYLAEKYGLSVAGIDILDFNIRNAKREAKKRKLNDKVHFRVMDYSELTFADETFDGIYTMETLVHANDYKKVLKQFHRVLKKKGRLVLFEYSILPSEKLTAEQKEIADTVITGSGMHSFPKFQHNSFPAILKQAGFTGIHVEVITPRMLPMLKQFHDVLKMPYLFIKRFRLAKQFPNIVSAVEGYEHMAGDIWRYNIVTARK